MTAKPSVEKCGPRRRFHFSVADQPQAMHQSRAVNDNGCQEELDTSISRSRPVLAKAFPSDRQFLNATDVRDGFCRIKSNVSRTGWGKRRRRFGSQFTFANLGHAFASLSGFRKAASPTSDTLTHFGSGEASAS